MLFNFDTRSNNSKNLLTYPTFKILNFGIWDSETGNSEMWLLNRFKISKLTRFAKPGGMAATIDAIFLIICF